MKILLTNDDGIQSEALLVLKDALVSLNHDVWIVAPYQDRSGTGHSMSFNDILEIECLEEKIYSCKGTPVDCVAIARALKEIFPLFDLVISGINKGANLGSDVMISGTAGAAREAGRNGIKAIAISCVFFTPPFFFKEATDFLVKNLDYLISIIKKDSFVNINYNHTINKDSSFIFSSLSRRRYDNSDKYYLKGPKNTMYYKLYGYLEDSVLEEGSDAYVINNNQVAVSLISTEPYILKE